MDFFELCALKNDCELSFNQFKDTKIIMIVNTASLCGRTPELEELQRFYKKHKEHGFEILAFPCNQFDKQEPASNEEINQFCKKKFGINFHIFNKIDVNGENTHPVYKYLKKNCQHPEDWNGEIGWNFEKFIIINKENDVHIEYFGGNPEIDVQFCNQEAKKRLKQLLEI